MKSAARPKWIWTGHVGLVVLFVSLALGVACSSGGGGSSSPIVVDTLLDDDTAPVDSVTLRDALADAKNGQRIIFDETLDGGTIELSIVGEEHSILKGEIMGIRMEPSGPVSYLVGYFDRDYGRSALYARKNVKLDASDLPSGLTIAWTGGMQNPARVLAVYGDLTLQNISITGGMNMAEDISTGDPDDQPWTLARGGGVAVWGRAELIDCQIYNNHVEGDFDRSRDRGAFGGGVYADIVELDRCFVSGNSVLGAGAAGGGVYSVGGVETSGTGSTVDRSSITGNRIQGLYTYGGGLYSDGGGIGNHRTLEVHDTTIAQNLVEPAPGLPAFILATGYWRGGGVYMSNGNLKLKAVTIVENEVHGVPRTDDLDKSNLAGGVAASIGNAHAIEDLMIGHAIIAGNTVHEIGGAIYDHDVFTGSTFYFRSLGYNLLGELDFSQMLVPVGQPYWLSLSRRHFPQVGDEVEVDIDDVLDRSGGVTRSAFIRSVGPDAPGFAVLHYEPRDRALDQITPEIYPVYEVFGEYAVAPGGIDDFLSILLERVEAQYGLPGFAVDFTLNFEDFLQSVDTDENTPGAQPYLDPYGNPILTLAETLWFGPAVTWPKQLYNYPYIEFWHQLDVALLNEDIPGMGPEVIGDAAWRTLFASGPLVENPDIQIGIASLWTLNVLLQAADQLGTPRPAGLLGDVGAIEVP